MIGPGCALVPALLVTLIAWSYLFDTRHGGSGLAGVAMGTAAFLAVMSGWFLTVMFQDYRERHRYPDRSGIGFWGVLPPIVFVASIALTRVLFQMIQGR
jgi:hypothetical protein